AALVVSSLTTRTASSMRSSCLHWDRVSLVKVRAFLGSRGVASIFREARIAGISAEASGSTAVFISSTSRGDRATVGDACERPVAGLERCRLSGEPSLMGDDDPSCGRKASLWHRGDVLRLDGYASCGDALKETVLDGGWSAESRCLVVVSLPGGL